MRRRGPDRRAFLKSALLVGGSAALSACVGRMGPVQVPTGNPDGLPDRQFAWNDALPTGPHGNVKLPNHQLLFGLNYIDEGTPTAQDREEFARALRTLERAFPYGTGDAFNPSTTRGLLTMIGYSPAYFDRFPGEIPETWGLQRPGEVADALDEDVGLDTYDAWLVLTSDDVQVLLRAEQALRGNIETVNGVSVTGSLDGVLEVADRRTGFLGVGRPAREFDADVPDISPTAMGFRSGFKDNQASERRVAIEFGPQAGGTTMLVSRITFDLDSWYAHDEPSRVHRMFSPVHTPDEVGEIGEHLGGRSRISRETAERTPTDASERGLVGHTQKVAMARTDRFEPKLLRRSEGVSIDLEVPSMNFISLQRRMSDFLDVRRAMNGAHFDAEVSPENDGILDFIDVTRRGTYFVPARPDRAFPTLGEGPA